MNPFRSNVGTLNEILFKDKNKTYGAYAIRKAYESTVLKSLLITVGIMLGGAWILSSLLGKEVEVVVPKTDDPATLVTYTVDLNEDKPKDQPKAKTFPAKSAAAAIKNNVDRFVIKNRLIDSTNIKLTDPVNIVSTGSTVNTGSTSIGDPPGNGTTTVGGGSSTNNEPFNYYEDPPECPGGLKNFWNANLHYPTEALERGAEGKVFINFVLDEEGKIMSCKVIKKLGYGCDEEVLRVVKLMPKWKPAKINGKPVKVTFNQAVDFRLK